MLIPDSTDDSVFYKDLEYFGLFGYLVGSDGKVWSNKIKGSSRRRGEWKELKQSIGKRTGRMMICFLKNGRIKAYQVHRLVLISFKGPPAEGMECCHNDGNPLNNKLSNLRWDTHRNNILDKEKHGTDNKGEKHGLSKLTREQVLDIRRIYAEKGISQNKLGMMFGVSRGTIGDIIRRKNWSWLCP